jgi:hypothetical protein
MRSKKQSDRLTTKEETGSTYNDEIPAFAGMTGDRLSMFMKPGHYFTAGIAIIRLNFNSTIN